jgi:transcriptional regulator with XRE-family HTH domain
MSTALNTTRTCCVEFDPYATGARLRKMRKSRNLTLSDLADHYLAMQGYQISVNSLQAWEVGKKIPSISHLLMLATFYQCTLDELVVSRRRSPDGDDGDQLVPLQNLIRSPLNGSMQLRGTIFIFSILPTAVDRKAVHLSL